MSSISFTARTLDDVASIATQCAVLPIFKNAKLSKNARQLDRAAGGAIGSALKLGDFSGKAGETLMLPGSGKARRLLLVGCGEEKKFDRAGARKFCDLVCLKLNDSSATDAMVDVSGLKPSDGDMRWLLGYLSRELVSAAYRYTRTVSKPKPTMKLRKVTVNIDGRTGITAARKALQQGRCVGTGINQARELANLPGNICTPTYLAKEARKLGRGNARLGVSVLEEKKMLELGMGSLLSVSAGSDQPAKLIIMDYKGGKKATSPTCWLARESLSTAAAFRLNPARKWTK